MSPTSTPSRPEESTKETLEAIDELLKAHPGEYAAMVFELIIGEGGFYPGSATFFETVMEKLKEEGLLIFMDEVQSFAAPVSLLPINTLDWIDSQISLLSAR